MYSLKDRTPEKASVISIATNAINYEKVEVASDAICYSYVLLISYFVMDSSTLKLPTRILKQVYENESYKET